MNQRPVVALQLYTLRDLLQTDMAGALKEVSAMGYEGVEIAGYGDLGFDAALNALRANNLKIVGNHAGLDALQNDLQSVIDENLLLDNKYVACSYLEPKWHTKEGFIEVAGILNEAGVRLNSAGIQLCYHNHDFEFARFDGQYGLDLIYENSDPKFLQAELDTYWVQKGGADPAAYIEKYSGRVPLLHIKDMKDDESKAFAEIGTGVLKWPEIFAAAEAAGVIAYIVEQDTCPGDPMDSVRISIENLKKMGKLN